MTPKKSKTTEEVKEKKKFKEKNGNKCVYCGCTNKLMLTIDHIIPLVRGGPDTDENKQVCCYICNQLKGPLNDEEFKEYMMALEILQELTKVRLDINIDPIVFNQQYYPDFPLPDIGYKRKPKDLLKEELDEEYKKC